MFTFKLMEIMNKNKLLLNIKNYLVFSLLLSLCLITTGRISGAHQDSGITIKDLLEQIAIILHGPERWYVGTDILCKSVGQNIELPIRDFFLEKDGGCKMKLIPNICQLNSPAQAGALAHITDDMETTQKLLSLLDQLGWRVGEAGINPLQKVAVQMVLWDIYTGLMHRKLATHPRLWKTINTLILKCREVLGIVLLSEKEIRSLPDTLPILDRLARTPQIKPSVERLLNPQGGFLEISNPEILHTMITKGRLVTRVFFELGNHSNWQHIMRKFIDVDQGSVPHISNNKIMQKVVPGQGEVERLPVKYLPSVEADFHGILIAFVAVLNKDWEPMPTPIVAIWAEYQITGVAPSEIHPNYPDEGSEYINIRSIDLRRLDGSPNPTFEYGLTPDDFPEPVGVLPRNNTYDGGLATTHRDNCLGCHSNIIAALNKREPTVFQFSKPFDLPVPLSVQEYWEKWVNLGEPP